MEIIDISGYVAEEKLAIAQKYLIPQVLYSYIYLSIYPVLTTTMIWKRQGISSSVCKDYYGRIKRLKAGNNNNIYQVSLNIYLYSSSICL